MTLSKLNADLALQQAKVIELGNTVSNQNINIETMRNYIKSLEEEVAMKTREVLEKNKLLRRF